jgi:hypothetical protein
MREAFDVIQKFLVGSSYGVFTVGCVLAFLGGSASYYGFFSAFTTSLLLLILAWITGLAART